MDAESCIGLHALDAHAFLLQHLRRGVHINGDPITSNHSITVKRNILCNTPSVMVQMGTTTAIASVSYLIGSPAASRPNEGDVVFDVRLPANISASDNSVRRDRGKSDAELAIEGMLYKLVTSSNAPLINLTQLGIKTGVASFRVCVSVICLALSSAAAADVCASVSLAVLAATPVPMTSEDPAGVFSVLQIDEHTPYLKLSSKPVVVTVAVIGGVVLISPSCEEEELADKVVRCALDEDGRVRFLSTRTARGCVLGSEELRPLLSLADQSASRVRNDIFGDGD